MNRVRLSAIYVTIVFAGLLVFATAAVFVMDRTMRYSLDSRLATAAKASSLFIDVRKGKLAIDADDRKQFLSVLGVDSDGTILDEQGNVVLSSAARPPRFSTAGLGDSSRYFDAGSGDRAVRVYAAPIRKDGNAIGEIVVWRSSDYIGETDRNAAFAFGAGALLIALLAVAASNIVTRRALEDAFARQRRFTADASHELRAPLAVIRAETDLALRRERDSAAYRAAFETIAGEADRMEALIGDLLSAARAESGRVQRERVDATQVVNAVSCRLESALTAKRAKMIVESDGAVYVRADAHELERAVLAVAHNAVRHVPEQGQMRMKVQRDRSWCGIEIEDDGPGFRDEALEHAVERFWREGSENQGSGLGLAIAKSIVESFGGRLSLSNRPGGGARVELRLPAWG